MNTHAARVARTLLRLLGAALTVLGDWRAAQQAIASDPGWSIPPPSYPAIWSPTGSILMRRVVAAGITHVTCAEARELAAEWGHCGSYIEEAVKVAAWSPYLAREVAANRYPISTAIEHERAARIGPYRDRHPEMPRPLPGPESPHLC